MGRKKLRVSTRRHKEGNGVDVFLSNNVLSDLDFDEESEAESSVVRKKQQQVPKLKYNKKSKQSKTTKTKIGEKGRKKRNRTGDIPIITISNPSLDFDDFEKLQDDEFLRRSPQKMKKPRRRSKYSKRKRIFAALLAIGALAGLIYFYDPFSSESTGGDGSSRAADQQDEYFPQLWREPELQDYPEDFDTANSLAECAACCYELNEKYDGGLVKNETLGITPPEFDLLHYRVCISYGCKGFDYDCKDIKNDVFNEQTGEAHPRNNSYRGCVVGENFREDGWACFTAPKELKNIPAHFAIRSINFTCTAGVLDVNINDCDGIPMTFTPPPVPVTAPSSTQAPTSPSFDEIGEPEPTNAPVPNANVWPSHNPTTITDSPTQDSDSGTQNPTGNPTLNPDTGTGAPTLDDSVTLNETMKRQNSSFTYVGVAGGLSGASAVASFMNFRPIG
uniref:Uncharacterized protein n=1 Tax=Aplanochytrium stocchinoi TaxID=215587 RepID=A0A7S3PJX1_9STRA|mmetsp:Transcript_35716/g.44323  ORF Transcript_35716/g.44323 Transcript_35716/m.44323 type:complete len:447 (-) Transcript_35716:2434-3774(-)